MSDGRQTSYTLGDIIARLNILMSFPSLKMLTGRKTRHLPLGEIY